MDSKSRNRGNNKGNNKGSNSSIIYINSFNTVARFLEIITLTEVITGVTVPVTSQME